MENYIVINGRKAELTAEQIKALGLTVEQPKVFRDYTLEGVLSLIRGGHARQRLPAHSVLNIAGFELEVIGHNHDVPPMEMRQGPTITVMAKRTIANRPMKPGTKGWADSELRKWLNEEYFDTLPDELRSIIRPTERRTIDSKGYLHISVDKLFVPTESELFGSAIYSAGMAGDRYEAFATSEDRVRLDADGDRDWYWASTPRSGNATYFVNVNTNGPIDNTNASNSYGVPLCFQIS